MIQITLYIDKYKSRIPGYIKIQNLKYRRFQVMWLRIARFAASSMFCPFNFQESF